MKQQIPNMLTIARLVLAGVFFAVLSQYRYEPGGGQAGLLIAALVLFVIAAVTDALDGFLARRWNAISLFGRVMDPVCDKILVIGAFIFLAGPNFLDPAGGDNVSMITGVYPWMVVVILLRELLVTSIRAALEGQGIAFGAVWAGKWKMILQAIVVPIVLAIVWYGPDEPWLRWTRDILVWATVVVTIISGLPYITNAAKAMKGAESESTD
jgi:CDP-diacylglycerol--glycerol-3-phosphate 3-phosphatidyltransferase